MIYLLAGLYVTLGLTTSLGRSLFKWDWSTVNLVDSIKSSLEDMEGLGRLEEGVSDTMSVIFGSWANRKVRALLQKHFPLLGVTDLENQIKQAVEHAGV